MTPFVKNALTLLNAERLSDAISYIRKRLIADRNTRALDTLNGIDSTYSYLLKYLAEGQPDPDRTRMYADIREKLYSIVRSIEVEQEMKESTLLYYTLSRNNNFSQRNFSEAFGRYISAASEEMFTEDKEALKKIYTEKDRALKDIFSLVWTLPIGYSEEIKSIANVAAGRDTDSELASLIVSALTLNLLTVYDREKFIALVDLLNKGISEDLYARTLVGIILILAKYPKRLASDPQLATRFEVLSDSQLFGVRLKEAVYGLVKARGGINLMHKIEDEIMPDLMKVGPKIMEEMKDKDGKIDLESLEMNPEWEKLQNGKMGKKLRKLMDIQNDGGDMMLSMFSKLVNNFHFFNDIDVWFRPYTKWEGKRLGVPDRLNEIWNFMRNAGMCDTDKYLSGLNMARLPESARSFMQQGMDAQQDQMMEEMKSMEIKSETVDYELAVQNYTRVLFRFYNFFRLRNEFSNPFASPMNIESLPFIGDMIADEETLSEIGEYYFRQGFYEDSISLFKSLMALSPLDRYVYCQKIGFAYEKLGNYSEAIRFYTDSSLEGNHDEWLMKKIRNAATHTGDEELLNYALTQLQHKHPDDLTYLKELIALKLRNPQYDSFNSEDDSFESDKLVGRAYYLAPEDEDVLLYRAERAFVNGDCEKAQESIENQMNEISMYLAANSLSDDFNDSRESEAKEDKMASVLLFAGSLALAQGEVAESITLFSQILLLKNADIKRSLFRDRLTDLWSKSLPLNPHLPLLPLYLEAIYRTRS